MMDIKSCPFCGSDKIDASFGAQPPMRHIMFFRCDGCGAVVSFRGCVTPVTNWNTRAEVERLRAELDSLRIHHLEDTLEWRGINIIAGDQVCVSCGGSGVKAYANTSLWRGGVGGQTITTGICDHCWGSGHDNKPWENLRLVESMRAESAKWETLYSEAMEQLRERSAELEQERMRLAACGVVALANTPESAARARDMAPAYRSASCGDVASAVDREMALRAELERERADARRYRWLRDSIINSDDGGLDDPLAPLFMHETAVAGFDRFIDAARSGGEG